MGYAAAFTTVVTIQAVVTSAVAFGLLGLVTHAPVWQVVALAVGNAVLGVALGLFFSTFAAT